MSMPHLNTMPPNTNSKGGSAPPQHQQSQPVANPSTFALGDSAGRRNSGNNSTRTGTPRSMQAQRKQNRGSRRPRLEDDDAIAEHVRVPEDQMAPASLTLSSDRYKVCWLSPWAD